MADSVNYPLCPFICMYVYMCVCMFPCVYFFLLPITIVCSYEAKAVRYEAYSHQLDYVRNIYEAQNLKGHTNCMISLHVAAKMYFALHIFSKGPF